MSSEPTFFVIGKGFIFPKHKEAIEANGGKILEVVDGEDWWGSKLQKSKADWVVILTPNDWHYKMALMARINGKKVICEKPLTLCVDKTNELIKYGDVYTVYQLRHLPEIQKLRQEILSDLGIFSDAPYIPDEKRKFYDIKLNVSVHRDPEYFQSWKGTKSISGGILFNTGIHYFDLIIYLFGEPTKWGITKSADERVEGWVGGGNYKCDFIIDLLAPLDKQERSFTINGKPIDLFAKQNLHVIMYKELLEGRGITAQDALPSIKLAERLSK